MGSSFPSQMAQQTGVSVHDYKHVFRFSVFAVFANFGGFGLGSYPELQLSIAREESNVLSLFRALNATITSLTPPQERHHSARPLQ